MSAIRGFAIVIVIAIIILFFWCFIFGKCSGRGFGTVPPRPITSRTTTSEGRRRSEDDDNNNNADNLQVSGSGSGGTGASGSGRGRIQERLQVSGSGSGGGSGASGMGSGTSEVGDPCAGKSGFDWLSCKASQGFKNITEGKTIFGAPHPGYMPRVGVVPIPLGRRAVIIA